MLCTSGFVDDVVFSHNGANTGTDLESMTCRIIHCDLQGRATKLHTRGQSLPSSVALLFLLSLLNG